MKSFKYQDGLESERLVTRFLKMEDWPIWAKFFEDEGVDEFLPDFGETEGSKKAQKWIEFQLKRYEDKTFGMHWLVDKETNREVGQCGLLLQDIKGIPELEIGYDLFKSQWGKGYATEAAHMFRNYGFESQGVESIISLIDPKNVRSQGVAERNGMTKGSLIDWKEHKLNVWRITRMEWAAL